MDERGASCLHASEAVAQFRRGLPLHVFAALSPWDTPVEARARDGGDQIELVDPYICTGIVHCTSWMDFACAVSHNIKDAGIFQVWQRVVLASFTIYFQNLDVRNRVFCNNRSQVHRLHSRRVVRCVTLKYRNKHGYIHTKR